MTRQTTQKRRPVGFTAANGRTPKAFDVSRVTTFGLIAAGLAITTFGIYAQVIGHHFITFDDLSYIEDNPIVNRGVTLAGLAWVFTTFHSGNWHPLTWIAHMIDSQLVGIFAGGHLLVNALIHVADTLLDSSDKSPQHPLRRPITPFGLSTSGKTSRRHGEQDISIRASLLPHLKSAPLDLRHLRSPSI